MAEEETEHGELRSLPTTTGGGLAGYCWVPVGLTWTPRTRPRPHRARSGGRALGRQSPRRRRRVARTEALSQLRGWGEAPRPIAGRRASSRAGSASDWSSTATPQPGGGAAGWQEAWTAGIEASAERGAQVSGRGAQVQGRVGELAWGTGGGPQVSGRGDAQVGGSAHVRRGRVRVWGDVRPSWVGCALRQAGPMRRRRADARSASQGARMRR